MLVSAYYLRNSPNMTVDPFSDVLNLIGAQSLISGGFTAGGSWALRFPAPDKIKFFALIKGSCWLRIEGTEVLVRVETGDVFLLAARRTFVLASDMAVHPVDARRLFANKVKKFATLGDGDDCIYIGGHVLLDSASGGLLADVLPPLIHVKAGSSQATSLKWLLEQLVREQAEDLAGSGIASAQLAQLLFIQLLRAHLETSGPSAVGWLRALSDRRLAPVFRLLHGDPGRQWSLEELAKAATMSRTTFASRFKAAAGVAPLTYLTQWRMHLAQRALREERTPVSVLAGSLGYASESAFSNAFKRVTGTAPKHYRSAARSAVTVSERIDRRVTSSGAGSF
jgi:AraC-like DNA-binding protein